MASPTTSCFLNLQSFGKKEFRENQGGLSDLPHLALGLYPSSGSTLNGTESKKPLPPRTVSSLERCVYLQPLLVLQQLSHYNLGGATEKDHKVPPQYHRVRQYIWTSSVAISVPNIRSLTPEEVANISRAIYNSRIYDSVAISAYYSLYVYYYLTTLAEEIAIMWPQRWRTGKVLFFLNRYALFLFITGIGLGLPGFGSQGEAIVGARGNGLKFYFLQITIVGTYWTGQRVYVRAKGSVYLWRSQGQSTGGLDGCGREYLDESRGSERLQVDLLVSMLPPSDRIELERAVYRPRGLYTCGVARVNRRSGWMDARPPLWMTLLG
ncbi:hypothetical protein DFP72DRAFT_1139779 [Ephemerocybe angulata]|uniref:DUF6533 domain-containing protein n=1 Tax=Ephemerocybe angulata TaxID=980116 RepID=A0A8H6LZT3_9AGAR|nr:hypothetical protein DFP72DRAFT_1139779 [Tulosesus angulatus]